MSEEKTNFADQPAPGLHLLERCIAGVGVIIALPIIALASLAIMLTSRGNPILAQVRVGQNEETFKCYKLRTMYTGTPQVGTHNASQNWITPVGRVLRAIKGDELPQLWNVVCGEMSFVGPRPCLPNQTELVEARRAAGIYAIRPGITGIGQVGGLDMSNPQKLVRAELAYLKIRSLTGNIRIVIATAIPGRHNKHVLSPDQKQIIASA